MKTKELIEFLKKCNPESEVKVEVCACNDTYILEVEDMFEDDGLKAIGTDDYETLPSPMIVTKELIIETMQKETK